LGDFRLAVDFLHDANVDSQQHVADVKRGELQLGRGAGMFSG
jgi:hypothetical protein